MYTFVNPSPKQKHTTGSLTHTHPPTSNNYKQKQLGTSHRLLMVIWLAPTLLSCAKFQPLRVIKKLIDDIGLAVGTPAGFAPTKECLKPSRWLGKRHKMDAFIKLGEPTIRAACTPQAFSDSFTSIWLSFPAVLLHPQQSVPTLRYTRRHLPSAVPWISEESVY